MDPHTKYIKGRWITHPYDYVAIKYQGQWLYFERDWKKTDKENLKNRKKQKKGNLVF